MVEDARIILACLEGKDIAQVAHHLTRPPRLSARGEAVSLSRVWPAYTTGHALGAHRPSGATFRDRVLAVLEQSPR